MFRYIAIAWDHSNAASAALAQELGLQAQSRAGWHAAAQCLGLKVFTAGTKPGANGVYPLLENQGVVLGRLFRRRDSSANSTGDVSLTSNEAERIRSTGGRALVLEFWGRYIAFITSKSRSTCVLRDPSGTLPCFLIRHEGVSIVFSWLEDVLSIPSIAHVPSVDWDAVAAHIVLGALGGRGTALQGVAQILPGELLDLADGQAHRHGHASPVFLWDAVAIARSPSSDKFADAMDTLREAVRSCTRSWASCYETILLRLSGGVDSSILLSCLASDSTSADVICLNYHSEGSNSDERRYARSAAVHVGRDLIERQRDPDFDLESLLRIARTPSPVSPVGWMNAKTDARLAAAYAAPALFTGAGGDQLFFEFPFCWPAADYLQLRGLDTGFASAAMDAARLGRVSVWQAVALAFLNRVRPIRTTLESSSHRALLEEVVVANDKQRDRFIHPALLHSPGLPIGKHMQTWALLYPVGYYDPFEQASAPELVHPLLSQPLMELCLRLPTYLLTQGGRGRALARRAFASELPSEIVNRRSKGGLEEHIKEVLSRNLTFARSMLLDGELVRRGLLNRAAIEDLLSGRPTTLSASPGRIHDLIGVEAWLSRWLPPSRRASV